jgi:DNA repair exonuclease SbcCD ATPase subunit
MITLEQEMSTLAVTIQELQEKISIAEQYDHYQKAKQEIADLENERSAREKDYHILENRIKGAYGLEKAAIDAEFISLEKTIASLNTHADLYLKQMFENELSAQLSIKRLTKKGDLSARPSIEVQVQYRGALYDDIDDLSGGERQQCDLAFLLAVNDMLGSDILLLDECLNNLDAEINMATLSYLRDLSINKRVLIVAHEAISGVFDNELPMKRSEDE